MVLEQNYLKFGQQYYKQTEGLALGAPTSTILAEVYMQYIWSINKITNSAEAQNNWKFWTCRQHSHNLKSKQN
jgi:hypothetical protein